MRRAMILIALLTVLSVSAGLWTDFSQQRVAREYLDGAALLRGLMDKDQWSQAAMEQAYLHAKWQSAASKLNCLISHHHTRAVTTAMIQLATAFEKGWHKEAYQALDQLVDALTDVEQSDFPYLENIL